MPAYILLKNFGSIKCYNIWSVIDLQSVQAGSQGLVRVILEQAFFVPLNVYFYSYF